VVNESATPHQPPWFLSPPSSAPQQANFNNDQPVIIVGAGLAGCHTANELARRNVPVVLLDAAEQVAAGASGNHAGIVKPFVTRQASVINDFYRCAFEHLLQLFDSDHRLKSAANFNQCGVLQLLEQRYPESLQYQICTPERASEIAGTRIASSAIFFTDAGWLNPAALCKALVQHPLIDVRLASPVTAINKSGKGWSVKISTSISTSNSDASELTSETLIIANGHRINEYDQTRVLPITPARGQCNQFALCCAPELKTVISGKRYAIPTGNALMIGASFNRDNTSVQLTEQDEQQNQLAVNALLPDASPAIATSNGFCAVRATTPDRLPVVGAVPDFAYYAKEYALLKNGLPENRFAPARYLRGLYIIGGFGSRGIVSAPYCAKLLIDQLCGAQEEEQSVEPGLASWCSFLHPARFAIRALRKGTPLV